jgi:hypothetical protein
MKKKVLLLLGIMLLVVGTAYGTWAYFSDTAEQDMGIKLTLGNVVIESESDESWKYENSEQSWSQAKKSNNQNNQYENVSPGDSFSREFEFKNKGTLVSVVTFNDSNETLGTDKDKDLKDSFNYLVGPYTVQLKSTSEDSEKNDFKKNGIEIKPGKLITFNMKISVDENIDNSFNKKDTDVETENINKITLDLMNEKIKVTATQKGALQ